MPSDSVAPDPGASRRPLLAQRNFLALFGGQLISISGERLTYFALTSLIYEHTNHFQGAVRTSLLLSVLLAVMLLPVLLFAPFTGAWVDRSDLKRVMVISDAIRALFVALIPVIYAATHQISWVFALVFLLFTCNVFFLPAKSAIAPEIVPPQDLLLANALLTGAGAVGTALSVAGTWLVDHLGWGRALYVNAATYLVSVVSLLLIRYRPAPHPEPPPPVSVATYLSEVAEGWRLLRSNPRTLLPLIALAAIWVGGGFLHVAGQQHIQHAAGSQAGQERSGGLVSLLAVGSVLGIGWVNSGGRSRPRHALLGGGLMLAAVGLVAFAVSSRFAVFAAAALLVGLGGAPAFVLPETMLQEATEARQRGRIFSALDFLMRLVLLVGVGVAGFCVPVPWIGTGGTLLIAAAMMVGAGLLAFSQGKRIDSPPPVG